MRNPLAAILLCTLCGAAQAQDYPARPVHLIATVASGSLDLAARMLAQGLREALGQPVVVENRAGGGGIIAVEAVKTAPPDGHTIGFFSSAFWIVPLMQHTPYDPLRDFAPVVLAVSSTNVLVVHPDLPAKTVKELLALAKARPGALNYGASSTGSGPHLAGELFKAMGGVDMLRVPYKGGAETIADLLAGRLQLAFATPGTIAAHVKSGKLRALAVTGEQPSALAPDLPTVAETIPGFEAGTYQGLFAPAKVPRAIIARLNQESTRFLARADVRAKLLAAGTEPAGNAPEQFEAMIRAETAKWGKLIRSAGIRPD